MGAVLADFIAHCSLNFLVFGVADGLLTHFTGNKSRQWSLTFNQIESQVLQRQPFLTQMFLLRLYYCRQLLPSVYEGSQHVDAGWHLSLQGFNDMNLSICRLSGSGRAQAGDIHSAFLFLFAAFITSWQEKPTFDNHYIKTLNILHPPSAYLSLDFIKKRLHGTVVVCTQCLVYIFSC